jgi:predicted signal transduction protein with EAL and GGDEF domain
VRDTDVVARLGGDEFAVLQTIETGGTAAAATLAQRILQVIGNPYEFDGHRLNVGTSIGIAIAPDDGSEIEPLMKRADLALYRAKSEGRNAYRFFEPGMETIVSDRRQLEIDLRVAIANNELEVHYQPVADTGSRTIHGVEALVRWRHPQRGLVTPDRFIPIAEETGLILPVGEWVLRTACADAATLPGEMKVAVNLSSIQFRDGNLLKTVTQALADAKLPAQRLELEITESVLLQNTEENIAVLYQLRALGVSIVLDDFGIGYSSLSYLQNFPFDRIKIDRSFVANLPVRPDCAAIVCAVTSLARSLNMATTGEGVETLTQLELLHAAGCTQAQGYLFGRPCPISELDLSGAALPAGDKAA